VGADRRIRVLELRSVRGTGGGPEKTILLGAALADAGRFHTVVCYVRDNRDEVFGIGSRAEDLGLDYVEIRERHSLDFRAWRQLLRLVHDRQIDIVHSHEYKTDAMALWVGRRSQATPLATAHGWTGQSARERRVYYPIDKRLLARFPRVIAVSSEIRAELVRCGATAERVTLLLNGIDPDAFRRQPDRRERIRQQLSIAPEHVVIGAVGRLERQKRFDLLFEAVAPMTETRPNLRVLVVGDGSLRNELGAIAARLGLADRVAFLGHRSDIADLHQGFDLFVQASEYEGTPNSVLEAMAMETPIVATDVGGTRELAWPDIHGLIVPPHDVPALRAAIQAALDQPSATALRTAAARRRVETDLSFSARTRRLEALYEDIIRTRDEMITTARVPHHA
jgi:glycosyltransferase involved in cell wall biosynthesis